MLDVDFKIIVADKKRVQILFYRRNNLKKCINEKWRNKYLKRLGYTNCANLEITLNILADNFTKKDFPHEIGIFLGYPLKDVIGFIEYKDKAQKIKGTMWKVYGRPGSSLLLMSLYKKISVQMEELLKTNSVFDINYNNFQN